MLLGRCDCNKLWSIVWNAESCYLSGVICRRRSRRKNGTYGYFYKHFLRTFAVSGTTGSLIPSAATGPVLIYIGINMLGAMRNIDYSDITEYIPAFLCVTFTIFANNIANGICVALPAYLVMKIAAGKIKKVEPVMYVLVAVCLLYFYSII